MTHFLTTSSVCLAAFLSMYFLLLEREKMHRFNRYFLLAAIAFSLATPLYSFDVLVETAISGTPAVSIPEAAALPIIPSDAGTESNYAVNMIWITYCVIAALLLIRLVLNLLRFYKTVKRNSTDPYHGATLVLLENKVQPHTFCNYIFLNKKDYENGRINDQLLRHELAHARQRHSADIIFIEVLLAIFWFNPLLYFYKKAIRLNHEFLADEAVNVNNSNVRAYQELLLRQLSPTKGLYPASSLTYSLTKKRLIMMTKHTSPLMSAIKKLLVFPVAASLISAFCIEKTLVIQQGKNASTEMIQEKTGPVTIDEYFAGVRFISYEYGIQTKKEIAGKNVVIGKLYEELTEADKKHFEPFLFIPKPFVKKSPTAAEVKDIMNAKKYAIWIDGKNVPNAELSKYKRSDIAHFSGSVILKNARTKKHPQPFQYWFWTQKGFDDAKMGEQKRHYEGDKVEVFKKINKQ